MRPAGAVGDADREQEAARVERERKEEAASDTQNRMSNSSTGSTSEWVGAQRAPSHQRTLPDFSCTHASRDHSNSHPMSSALAL